MSIFSKAEKDADALVKAIDELDSSLSSAPGSESKAKLDELEDSLTKLVAARDKYQRKVAEGDKDPNRKIYGAVMVERIGKVSKVVSEAEEKLPSVRDQVKEILDKEAEIKARDEEEAAKRRKLEEEEERKRKEKEEAEQQARERAEEEKKRVEMETKRKKDEERQAKLAAAAAAKIEAETAEKKSDTTAKEETAPEGQDVITIEVVAATGKSFSVGTVAVRTTVSELKSRIAKSGEVSVPESRQRLVIKGQFLPDAKSLQECDMTSSSTVYLVELPEGYTPSENRMADAQMDESADKTSPAEGGTEVLVKSKAGTQKVNVDTSWTIFKLRDQLQKASGTDASDLTFVFQGKVLKNEAVLKDVGITKGSALFTMDKKRGSTSTSSGNAGGEKAEAPAPATSSEQSNRGPQTNTAAANGSSSTSAAAGSSSKKIPAPSGHVHKVTMGEMEFNEILEACGTSRLLVVDFSASWCGPCRSIAPVLERMAAENTDISFVGIDSEETMENRTLHHLKGITAMPTFQFYVNKNAVLSFSGARSDRIQQTIDQYRQAQGSRPPPPATSAAPPGPVGPAVMSALQQLKSSTSPSDFATAVATLLTYVSNVADNPSNEKFRRIRLGNEALQRRLGRHRGGVDCVAAFGFVQQNVNGEQVMVISEQAARNPELKTIRDQLRTAFQSSASTTEAMQEEAQANTTAATSTSDSAVQPEEGTSGDADMEDEQQLLQEAIRLSLQEDNDKKRSEQEKKDES
mmetsp:Transcript_1523/g.4617  ORF Transcript_1523/g.4617 Transcript_1523/m.4617 type:complete len:747 (+) Transcript_1523:152-2392(+)